MRLKLAAAVFGIAIATGGIQVSAADEHPYAAQIEARQAQMAMLKYNISVLGGMAKGDVPYDADLAAAAAANMLAIAQMKDVGMWPAGSSADDEGLAGNTRASSDIWGESNVMEKHDDMVKALQAMSEAAADGLDALRANMGDVGGSCKGCHEKYRTAAD